MRYFFEADKSRDEALNMSGIKKITTRDLKRNARNFFSNRSLLQLLSRRKEVVAELRNVFELISEGKTITPQYYRRLKNYMDRHPEIKEGLMNLFSSPEQQSSEETEEER